MFTQHIFSYLRYLCAAGKQRSSRFPPSCHRLKTRTTDVQTMSGPQTLETRERAACSRRWPPYFAAWEEEEEEECCSLCRYGGILPRVGRMDIADTRVLCSAARRWGTSHSKLPTEQESWILWNLHFNSYSTQKCQEPLPYTMIHWKPGRGEGENMWRESDSGGRRKSHEETYHTSFYCIRWQFYNFLKNTSWVRMVKYI